MAREAEIEKYWCEFEENQARGFKGVKLHCLNTEVIYKMLPYGNDLPPL